MSEEIRIQDMPLAERPRERLEAMGAEALSNAELVAILLRTGSQGVSALSAAQRLLSKFGSLDSLARAPLKELRTKGIGPAKAIGLKSAFTLAARMAREIRQDTPLMDSPERIAALLREDVRFLDVESFHVILLNTRRHLMDVVKIAQGTLDSILVHPREVFRPAIAANASAIILAHNHPSGDPTPSQGDTHVTRDLIRAGKLLKIDVLDHVILGSPTALRPLGYISMREQGYFYE
jgi:DNA repair protein RadC